jgi:hypothetical protein
MFRTLLTIAAAMSLTGIAHAQQSLGCLSEEAAREQFKSGELAKLPNYTAGPGARVQQQHPDTYMFGQAKHLGEGTAMPFVFCQYSNHVGLVAMFGVPVESTLQPLKGCDFGACRTEPWWRTEYVESDPADSKLMQVCVIDRDGQSYPSVGCRFVMRKQ